MGHPLTLAEKLATPPKRKTRCSIGHLDLDVTEARALLAMLDSPAWSDPDTVEALRDEGHTVSEQQLGKHRRRRCSCFA